MAEVIKIENGRHGYLEIIHKLLTDGSAVMSRNGNTLELTDLTIEVADATDAAPVGVRPGYVAEIGMVEALQLVGGFSDPQLTCEIAPNFRRFLDDYELYGSYGTRTERQMPVIARRLADDPGTRQAVVTLWNPRLDAEGGMRDHPCTISFNFLIRNSKLNMTTFMRSNDAWWGWPYDSWMFTTLQASLAQTLGIPVGTYTHHATSFHLYESHWTAAQTMLDQTSSNLPEPHLRVVPFGDSSSASWPYTAHQARRVWRALSGLIARDALTSQQENLYFERLAARRMKIIEKNYYGATND